MPRMYKPKRGRQRKRTDNLPPVRPRGRPTTYKPECCEIVKLTLGFGGNNKDCMERLGISEETFYQWVQKYPPFAESVRDGRNSLHYAVNKSAIKKATGYHEYDEKELIDEQGRIKRVKYKRYYEPDTQIIINHLNKTAPIYKQSQESQLKSLLLLEFDKLRDGVPLDGSSQPSGGEGSLNDDSRLDGQLDGNDEVDN